ncbi:MAG: hypothetical protein BWY37_01406 [Firmicutes bacterium ADurb.Bin262]|nr:MAG: hypothetical protein BWY37_01406 [Firmicutes bacterium ADurb.Bin262]
MPAQRIEQISAFVADTSADTDNFGLEGVDNVDNSTCDIIYIAVNNMFCGFIAFAHSVKSRPAGYGVDVVVDQIPHSAVLVMFHRVFGLRHKRHGRSISLPTAPSAAAALLAVDHDNHVPHLARGKIDAADNFAVKDNTAADTGAQRDRYETRHAFAGSRHRLAKRGAVGIVVKVYAFAYSLLKHFFGGYLLKIKVIGKLNIAGVLVDGTGCSDTDRLNLVHADI